MKKTLLLLSTLLCAMFTTATAQTNLLENGDFEKWTDGKPDNWASAAGNATLSQSTDAHEGSYSVNVAGASGNVRISYKDLTLKAGTYTMTFYTKAAEEDGAIVRPGYAIVGADGKVASGSDYKYGDLVSNLTTADWTKVEHEFTLEATTKVYIVVMNNKNGGGKAALIDDFSLTTTDGGIDESGTEPDPTPVTELANLSEVKTKTAGEYIINLDNAVVTYVNGNNAYLEDATAGILVYKSNHGLVAGQSISGKVNATLTIYNGLYELTEFNTSAATVTEGAAIPETVVSVAELTANPMKYESMRVKVVGVTATGAFTSRNATVSQDEVELALYQKSTKAEFTFGEGDVINVVGYPGMFKEAFQLNVWEASDVTEYSADGISHVTLQNGADRIYTIDGRRVQKLTKGLYIVNGKKVIVK